MSGTSLDGIDAVLADFSTQQSFVKSAYLPYSSEMRRRILAMHEPCTNELHDAAVLGNDLAKCYAEAVMTLLKDADVAASDLTAIGCHGQTVRHRPESSYTIQLGNAATLAELTGITVVADFRSRDLAAGGQGAPLVPAFHDALFRHPSIHRVIINIGGISNLSSLAPGEETTGFDCGPGNLLMDAWCLSHRGEAYDKDGEWADSGQVLPDLLEALLRESFFHLPPPKSTGRDLFNMSWLSAFLKPQYRPEDVQATLRQLTVITIADAITTYCTTAEEIYVCGGGARNPGIMRGLAACLPKQLIATTDALGVNPDFVEAHAFAWLARQTMSGKTGNLPYVTGAQGARVLGAIHPA